MYYAGIGARATPPEMLNLMSRIANKLEGMGYILRSGGAAGADTAFERGVVNAANRQIYLPGAQFNSRMAGAGGYINAAQLPSWQQALETVAQFHPAPERLSNFAKALMARNAMQVLGSNLQEPAKMVVAWTPGGQITGGTGQALRMAQTYGVPIRNLGNPETLTSVKKFLNIQ